jgi:hypothetical protein
MAATSEGMFPDFHEAFTQLHICKIIEKLKCVSGDRRDRGINPDTEHISWNNSSSNYRVDEDLGIDGIDARHHPDQNLERVQTETSSRQIWRAPTVL